MQLPPDQEAIRAKCFHPAGTFVEFPQTEQSIPERFESIARLYPARLAVKTGKHAFTYDELNKTANRIARLPSLFQSPTVAEMATVITKSNGRKLGEKDLDRLVTELESLSDEEARRLLADQDETATGN
jgi:hypothetical protein